MAKMVMIGAYVTFVVQETIRTRYPGLFDYSLLMAVPLAFIVAGRDRHPDRAQHHSLPLRTAAGDPAGDLGGCRWFSSRPSGPCSDRPTAKSATPSWMSGAFEIGQITITYNRLWILCFHACRIRDPARHAALIPALASRCAR